MKKSLPWEGHAWAHKKNDILYRNPLDSAADGGKQI